MCVSVSMDLPVVTGMRVSHGKGRNTQRTTCRGIVCDVMSFHPKFLVVICTSWRNITQKRWQCRRVGRIKLSSCVSHKAGETVSARQWAGHLRRQKTTTGAKCKVQWNSMFNVNEMSTIGYMRFFQGRRPTAIKVCLSVHRRKGTQKVCLPTQNGNSRTSS